ncbi:hypothetical protein AAUPMC_18889 [Pasteurella multocida subsp. multocida str. Anand1_cattle]|nr:hypothetical protein AAUPMC_18889 [Pasteurella multocida subsp. multocida str. Anand1_cattle]
MGFRVVIAAPLLTSSERIKSVEKRGRHWAKIINNLKKGKIARLWIS